LGALLYAGNTLLYTNATRWPKQKLEAMPARKRSNLRLKRQERIGSLPKLLKARVRR
jgi:hypothetical protein